MVTSDKNTFDYPPTPPLYVLTAKSLNYCVTDDVVKLRYLTRPHVYKLLGFSPREE